MQPRTLREEVMWWDSVVRMMAEGSSYKTLSGMPLWAGLWVCASQVLLSLIFAVIT
jgi:hypothetical protein